MVYSVALTGGIGSGKSTVAKLFAEHGVTIIDTDQIARNLTAPGSQYVATIVEQFEMGTGTEGASPLTQPLLIFPLLS